MAAAVIGNFESVSSTTSQQFYTNQAQGGWFFAGSSLAGIAHALNTSGNAAPSGTHCAILQTAPSTPVAYAYTVVTGLSVGQSYTIDFISAMRTSQSTADVFHVNVYDGTTTTVIWNDRTLNQWGSRTCTPFTATQSSMMVSFVARQDGATWSGNPSVLFDAVQITPGSGITNAATGVTFATAAIQRPASIVTSSLIGDFEGVFRNTGLGFFTNFGDNWYHYTGLARSVNEVSGGTSVRGEYSAFMWATHTRNIAYMYTVLQNLNLAQTYTITFRTITRNGYVNIPVNMFHVNVWSGTGNPVTIHTSTVTNTWTQRTCTFTPTQTTMMLVFTTYTTDTGTQHQMMVDDINISPWAGLDRTGGALTYNPVVSRNTLTSFTPASAPQNLVGRGGSGYLALSWSAPANNGGTTVLYYVMTHVASGSTTSVYGQQAASITTRLIQSNIVNNTTYTVTICAYNSAGAGEPATITLSTTSAAPTASSSALTSSSLGDFESVTNDISNNSVNGAADNWFFGNQAGVMLSISISNRPAPSGYYMLRMNPNNAGLPNVFAYTVISGMSTSTAYTVSLSHALVPDSGLGVDFLTVSVYDGATTTLIHSSRPTSINWNQVTCAPFTPTRGTVMLVITARNGTLVSPVLLVDNVQISPWAGLSRSSTGITYVPAASPTPSWELTSSSFGEFEGIITNAGDTQVELNNATSDNWYMGNRSGVGSSTSSLGTTSGLHALWLWAHSGSGTHMRSQAAYTVLTGLSTSTAYTITYIRASRNGLSSQTAGMLITINVFDGTNVTTISTGSTLTDTWSSTITCASFTPAASTVMVIVSAVSMTLNMNCQVLFDAFRITPFAGISKSLTGLTWMPQLGRNTLAAFGTPSAPTITSFSFSGSTITINWSAPTNNGGSTMVFYGIMMTRTNGWWVIRNTNDMSTLTWSEGSLTAGVGYTFRVYAFNAAGAGTASAPVELTIPVAVSGTAVEVGASTPTSFTPAYAANWVTMSTAQARFGQSSLFSSDRTMGFCRISNVSSLGFTGSWTCEAWVRPSSFGSGSNGILSAFRSGHWHVFLYYNASGTLGLQLSSDQSLGWNIANGVSGSTVASTNTWHHVALVYNSAGASSTYRVYLNGAQEISVTSSIQLPSTAFSIITLMNNNSFTAPNQGLVGYVDEFRVSRTARYLAGFSPSTQAFASDADTILLHHFDGGPDGSIYFTRFGQETPTPPTFQGNPASGWFPINHTFSSGISITTSQSRFGTSCLTSTASTSILRLGSDGNMGRELVGDWTIEAWIRPNAGRSGTGSVFSASSLESYHINMALNGSGNPILFLSSSGNGWNIVNGTAGSGVAAQNTWSHIALVYNGSAYVVYLNGVQEISITSSTRIPNWAFEGMALTNLQNFSNFGLIGQLDEFRVSKTARYASAFTPPTQAFVSDSDTVVLHHFDGTNGSTDFGASGQETPAPVSPGVFGPTYPGTAFVTWSTTNAGSVSYNVQYTVDGGTTILTGLPNPWAYITGLLPGRVYSFSVATVTNLGTTAYSSAVNATPADIPAALSTSLLAGFDDLSTTTSAVTLATQAVREWRFATGNIGIWHTSQFPGQTGNEGIRVAFMSGADQRIYTYLHGLALGTSYTLSFIAARRLNNAFPDVFYVNAYDGTTVRTLFAGRPATPDFATVTCTPFVATGPHMLIVFGSSSGFVLFDNVRITPFANVRGSPIGPWPAIALAQNTPATLFSTTIGNFEGLSTNEGAATSVSTGDRWTFSSAGTIRATVTGAPGIASPGAGTMVAYIDTTSSAAPGYIFTILGGLSLSTVYTVSFAMSAVSGGGFSRPDQFLVNTYDGALTGTLHNGLPPSTPEWVTQTVSFTPTAPSIMLLFVASQTGTGNRRIAIDNITLTPVAGVSRSATGIAFAPAAAQLVITGVPGAPRNLVATPSVGQITLTWTVPESQGLSLVSSYRIVVTGGMTQTLTGITGTSRTVTGLATGVSYTFAVSAINAQGTGQPTAVTATPATPSEAVSGNVVTATPSTLQHTWTPSAGEPAVGYVVYRDNVGIASLESTARSFTHTALSAATTYTLGVAALSVLGLTTRSNVTATTRPNPPQVAQFLTATGNTITASWFPPLVGGNGITGYNVYLDGTQSGSTVAANVRTAVVGGLAQGTFYNVGVSALTSGGEGLMANRVAVTLPAAPGNVRLDGNVGFRNVPLAWDPPADGGVRSGYFVRGNGGTLLATVLGGTEAGANVVNLEGNTSIAFQVQAYNAGGTGTLSTPALVANTASVNPDLYTFIQANILADPPVRPNTASSRFSVMDAVRAERAFSANITASVVSNTSGGAVSSASAVLRETANVITGAMRGVATTQSNRRRVLNTITRI